MGRRRIRAGEVGEGVVAKGVPTGFVVASRSKGLTAPIGNAFGDCDGATLDLNGCDCCKKLGAAMVVLMDADVVAGVNGLARLEVDDDDDGESEERNAGLMDDGGLAGGFETVVDEAL
jgi:hypothetical protein